jgi:hypothetical protein
MDSDTIINYLRERFEQYHDAVVSRVDEQFATHVVLSLSLAFAVPHITHLLWILWLHHFLTVFSSPFRTGWWN